MDQLLKQVQKPSRYTGEVIGEVGNTGVSSGAHLHYEVRYRNNTVNPIHYFNKDMTPEAYIDLMEQLSENK